MNSKLNAVREILQSMEKPLVAYSGGVDSTLLLSLAHDLAGDKAAGLIAISPTLPASELEEARHIAHQYGWRLFEVESEEMEIPDFTANTELRCYFCKDHRYQLLRQFARENGYTSLVDGSNADDLKDFRPGQKAAQEQGVRSPLQEAGLTKAEIRNVAKKLGLPNWDKPSSACLASRIPYGTSLTEDLLHRIGQAESALADLGFKQFRVRYHGPVARIEVPTADFDLVLAQKERIIRSLEKIGFDYVTLDLEGFRSGSMNKGIEQDG